MKKLQLDLGIAHDKPYVKMQAEIQYYMWTYLCSSLAT